MSTSNPVLLAVEDELQRRFADVSGCLREVCAYATEGGRRVRASLLLDVAGQCGGRAAKAATSLEMLHGATLLQDDIFDGGVVRRGRTAAHVRFGKAQTILASDWLLIRALEMAAEVDRRFFHCLAHAGRMMAAAEARELEAVTLASIEEAEMYGRAIAKGKTAVLFGAAMYGAAILRDLSPTECDCWQALGNEMGWTYQLLDDCVDLYVGEADAGKSVGHDLTAGCITVPMLLAASWLRKRGIRISIEELHQGSMEARDRQQILVAASSVEVKREMQGMLIQRLLMHNREAQRYGVARQAMEAWTADLLARTAMCFPSVETEQPSDRVFAGSMGPAYEDWRRYA